MTSIKLTGREYKLLLDAAAFGSAPTLDSINVIWQRRIRPVILQQLGGGAFGRKKGDDIFATVLRRHIQFFDTPRGDLAINSYSLRQRIELDEDGEPDDDIEITLKLRTPDLFVAAGSKLPARKGAASPKTKLEEDIAPLAVLSRAKGKAGRVSMPDTRSIRSRFSLSTRQQTGSTPKTVGQVAKLYPTLIDNLSMAGAKVPSRSKPFSKGPRINELAFRGPRALIGNGLEIGFTLTVWQFPGKKQPRIVEISYQCDLEDGEMSLAPALKAHGLFVALQEKLGRLVETEETSKTALALPKRIGAP